MKLQELLKGVAVTEVHADLETEVASIVYDSRKAVPGVPVCGHLRLCL